MVSLKVDAGGTNSEGIVATSDEIVRTVVSIKALGSVEKERDGNVEMAYMQAGADRQTEEAGSGTPNVSFRPVRLLLFNIFIVLVYL